MTQKCIHVSNILLAPEMQSSASGPANCVGTLGFPDSALAVLVIFADDYTHLYR